MSGLAGQYTFDGSLEMQGDVVAKARHLLEQHSEARDSYAVLVALYWLEFDGLAELLPTEAIKPFVEWMKTRATSWKTIQNRAMELQRNHIHLDSSPEVREQRKRQATQGAVR